MAGGRALSWGLLAFGLLAGLLMLGWMLWPAAPIVRPPSGNAAPSEVVEPSTPLPATDTGALMQRAREQLAAGALISPAGANAVETYLAVLQREPDHVAAVAAATEMQPVVADGIRGALAGADWAEAERLLGLLRRLAPDSVLLESLAAELAQRQTQAAAVEQARLAAAAVVEQVPAPAAAEPVSAPVPAAEPVAAPAAVAASRSGAAAVPASPAPPAEPVLPSPAAPNPPVAVAPAEPEIRETPARLLNNPPVSYPPQARRQRQEGWVEVEVRIDASGNVSEARVLRAEPPGVFDREALRTAQRWRFAPRELNGQAVASTARRRVAFSLGG